MSTLKTLEKLQKELSEELDNILNYWIENSIDEQNTGFVGQIDNKNNVNHKANKGLILNARILWTFSAAYNNCRKDERYLNAAQRAYDYIIKYFYDTKYKGFFWEVDYKGNIKDAKKQIYAQAFVIYGFSEFYKISKNKKALQFAIELFKDIEKHSFDNDFNGYLEAFSREWTIIEDLRLSDKDANEKKTMNTHLHILEAYTNLLKVWEDKTLYTKLHNLTNLFLTKFLDKSNYHFHLFFNEKWQSKSSLISYGHDIESTWLLYEAAKTLQDKELLQNVEREMLAVAKTTLAEGIGKDNSVIYEKHDEKVDKDRHWWVQAEAIVGFFNTFQITGNKTYLQKAVDIWKYTKSNIIDKKYGEWYFRLDSNNKPILSEDKVGFWKCPYHNSRACLEIIQRQVQGKSTTLSVSQKN